MYNTESYIQQFTTSCCFPVLVPLFQILIFTPFLRKVVNQLNTNNHTLLNICMYANTQEYTSVPRNVCSLLCHCLNKIL